MADLKRCTGGERPHELIIYGGPSCPVCFWRDLYYKATGAKGA